MAATLRAVEGGKGRKPKAAPKRPPRPKPAPVAQPSAAELRRHKQDVLVSLTGKHRAIDTKIDSAMSVVDELKGQRKEVRTAIINTGFRLDLFDEGYRELKLRTSKVDLEAKEEQRGVIREALGLPCGQPRLFDTPAERSAADWETEGYRAGLNGEVAETKDVPAAFQQDFMRGFGQVTERNAAGLKQLEDGAKPSPKSELPEGETVPRPDWREWPVDHHDWTDSQKDDFTLWYDGLDPNVEPDVAHLGVMARIRYMDEQTDIQKDSDDFA